MTTIAFVGLGNMGGPMAANLIKAGHHVIGVDLSSDAVARHVAAGGSTAASPAEAAAAADVVVTMLPSGREVRALYTGDAGIIAKAKASALFIDSSTIAVESARFVAAAAAAGGHGMLDAPVSGGVGGAAAGTLTFMVGGDDLAFECAKPILEAMGKTIVHAGAAGNGQAAKICNNMILGITMIATSEAFVMAEKLGLDKQKLFDIASKSSGQSWSMTTYCPVPGPVPTSPANRDYAPGFTVAMMLKDLKLAQDAAQSSGATTPLGAEATALYSLFASHGGAAKDFSGIIEFLRGR
ncbi:MAG: 3-hydroxyisobutyrate dehydrogenase [Alphaproteobacteria bacterium]